MRKLLFIVVLMPFFSNCTVNKKIAYNTKDIQNIQDEKLSKLILDIEDFSDKRKDDSGNQLLYTNSKQSKLERGRVCINAEKHYKKEPVARQITRMLINHFKKRNSFKTVVENKKDTADFYVTGNLTKFYGEQGFSDAAATGAQFGLIGAIATAKAKTAGKIIFEITDLKIYNKNNLLIKDIGTFKKEYEGDFPADAYCWCVYDNVNEKLKEYFADLITTIEAEIEKN